MKLYTEKMADIPHVTMNPPIMAAAPKPTAYDPTANAAGDMGFLLKLVIDLQYGNFKTASQDFDDYQKINPTITSNPYLFETLARTVGQHHLSIESILARMEQPNDYSYQHECFEIMKWAASRKFAIGDAHNIFIKRMCRLEFTSEFTDGGQSRRYTSHKSDALEFLDADASEQILDLLVSKINPNTDIDESILREIYNYTPYLCEIMMRFGFNILRLVDDIPFPWYVMRSATRTIYDKIELEKSIAQNQALTHTKSPDVPEWTTSHSQKFLSVLKNSKEFKFQPCYFTGCCDMRVMAILCQNEYFREKIIVPMPKNEPFNSQYLIQTVEEYPAIVDLLTSAGSPKPDSNEWDIAAIRNPRLMKYVLTNKKPDITQVNSNGWVCAAYAAFRGNLSRAHFEVLKQLYEYNSNGYGILSLPSFAWATLHIICNKFNMGLWLKMYRAKEIDKNIREEEARKLATKRGELTRPILNVTPEEEHLNSLMDLPNDDFMWQVDILDWLYKIVVPTVDKFGRTPLMCLPIPTANSNVYEPLFRRYGDKDAKVLNMTTDAFIQRLMTWRVQEYRNRQKEAEERERIIDTRTVVQFFPVQPQAEF
jgi:hypothetical protein